MAALFDDYADKFEAALVGGLEYRTPQMLREAIVTAAPGRRFASALDLGCGTGLAGAAVGDLTERLEGVDLSPEMVARARLTNLYASLCVGDIVGHLVDDRRYDLIFAADVLVYLGDLDGLFAKVAAALTPAGLFAFSVEFLDEGTFRLRPSGRYAHADSYVDRLALDHGLERLLRRNGDLRRDRGFPVAGSVTLLSLPG